MSIRYGIKPPTIGNTGNLNSLKVTTLKVDELLGAAVSYTLPAPLQSIADLTTSGNEMLYTTSTNTYATSGISSIGRSFLTFQSQSDQRSGLGLVIGSDVQAHSSYLDNLVTVGDTSSQIVISNGAGFTNSSITTYTRDNILPLTSSSELSTLISAVTAVTLSTTNAIVKISSTDALTETGITIDNSNNITGIVDLDLSGELDGITVAERTQLRNIGTTTISAVQWTYVGDLDQSLATTDTPTFTGLNAGNQKIVSVLNPTSAQDAATKDYVDTVASTGAPPLESVELATAAALSDSPTYATPAETLTSTGGPGTLVIDAVTVAVGNKILVKDQGTNTQNGIYVVTDDGASPGPNWVLTRASDFNQAAMPVTAGASIFVDITAGASANPGSSWALKTTVNNVDPLTDAVEFVQIGGSQTFTAGSGIDSAALVGGIITTDISARLKYTGNDLDLNTVTVPYGGTGVTTLTSNGVLVGQGASSVLTTKQAPSGDFVGDTDTQTLTNKTITDSTNNVIARALFTNSGAGSVSTFAATPPTSGQILTATSGTTATWQTFSVSNPDRTIRVYQSGPNTGSNYDNLGGAITYASTLTPTAADPVAIIVFPGTYSESTPLTVPAYVNIVGVGPRNSTIIRPTAPAPVGAVIQLNGNTNLENLIIDGNDGSGGYSTVGINSSVGTAFATDNLNTVTARNCTTANIKVSGNGNQYSKILIVDNISSLITASSITVTSGIEVEQGAILSGNDVSISGFLAGSSVLTNGLYTHDDFSYSDLYAVQVSSVVNAIITGGGTTTTSRDNYPTCRIIGAKIGFVSGVGVTLEQKSVCRFSDLKIDDDTATFPNQIHLTTNNPALPADGNFIVGLWTNLRFDLYTTSGATNNPLEFSGCNLSETFSEIQSQFRGELSLGGPGGYGAEFAAGEGDSNTFGMLVYIDDGGSFTDVTSNLKFNTVNPFDVDIATTGSINLSSAPATIDGVTPSSGVTRVLVKDGSTANPGSSSVDNGIYVWNGAGSAMTRAADFAASSTFSYQTWIGVDVGTVNYGSQWKLNTNITVGTTAFSLDASSSPAFPAVPVNNDAIYFGNTFYSFPGMKMTLSAPLTTSSGTSEDALVWEYWNGSAWTSLPLMSTLSAIPYTVYGDETFAYGDTITNPTKKSYQYRFGRIESLWATTTINGTLAYWVRARIIDASIITQVPVVVNNKISTDHTEINSEGFMEFFGDARPTNDTQIYLSALNATGTSGEFSPDTQTITVANNGTATITSSLPNCRWRNTRNTAISTIYIPHKFLDSSLNMKLKMLWNNGTTAGPANIALQVDYAFSSRLNQVFVGTTGTTITPDTTRTTGWIAYPVATLASSIFFTEIDLNLAGLRNNEDTNTQDVWIKLRRDPSSSGGLDTYVDSVYLHTFHIEVGAWCVGGYFD